MLKNSDCFDFMLRDKKKSCRKGRILSCSALSLHFILQAGAL
jgi:hypothetical protein